MKIHELNPAVRFAMQVYPKLNGIEVGVYDCRLFYCIESGLEIVIENKQYKLEKDSVFFCRGASVYKMNIKESASLYSVNFDVKTTATTALLPITPVKAGDGFDVTKACSDNLFEQNHFCIHNASEFKPVFKALCDEMLGEKPMYREKCSGLLKSLLSDIYRRLNSGNEKNADIVSVVSTYIDKNFTREISNSHLAQMTGYHEYHLNRLFKASCGMSIHKYILNRRIALSKQMLVNSEASLEEIAYSCGFNSNTYFSYYFKQQTGVSPTAFRNQFKGML